MSNNTDNNIIVFIRGQKWSITRDFIKILKRLHNILVALIENKNTYEEELKYEKEI